MPRNRRFATVEKSYITDIERERCKKVAAAYAELYELESILVLDVGRYGFVKLQYYTPEYGFNDVITYTDSESMFGKYLPPHFGEVEMTPEEIEEMKKREARKDRLHQNYLKRKANGKQQEYYERTKAKKKAEMDAKKEEIRQEDIAKGVFIPVSLLPPAEPKKGVASA